MKKLGSLFLACTLALGGLQAWELTIKAKGAEVAREVPKC
ncbi:hypothetical protein NHP194003_16010 [Helicobacter suis]|uniref:Uncharacterized protein n=5 Tax=Helicobacter suis TaxID=104628 RepID=A0A6J4CY65_9HELI|nr:hypothetical protein NHP190020_01920 [Helicobacter suis]BDR27614.1 hypothetical protein HSHS1_03750 [Helicobacter suis HS1]BCD48397.1 hypothetical protein NHP194003_16010 [Helicobacter suis]BCD50174.1 hypothetical protein NHP194004_16210 [Helicobacter suis]BCD51922.1 hypothetical protein NHP194022_15930 [Helicobacter suis]